MVISSPELRRTSIVNVSLGHGSLSNKQVLVQLHARAGRVLKSGTAKTSTSLSARHLRDRETQWGWSGARSVAMSRMQTWEGAD